MLAFIKNHIFAGRTKTVSTPQIFIILCIYTIIVSIYTLIFFGGNSAIVRFGISMFIVISYVVIEKSRFSNTLTAVIAPLAFFCALTFGSVYFDGDFLIFTYICCLAMISLTYLKPKSLLIYIIISSTISIVFLLFGINLLGASFSRIYNILYFLVSIALNSLIYIFCKFYVQSLDALTMAKNEANHANQAKSAFLSTMSHEIRTPLNAILGITEIQLQNENLDPDEREALNKVYTSGDLLLGIINDILDLSKIEAGKLELVIAEYELASLISDTAQLNVMRIGSKPIEFDIYVDEHLPAYLIGDELRVKQILNNLLSNAFKYTSAGVVKLSIKLKKDLDANPALYISVSDTGQGMSKEQIDKLFDEYSRFNMEANRTTEGTGLGMSITRNLIHMMNGDIHIESESGKGSTFSVTLPQKRAGEEILGAEMAENLHKFRSSSHWQEKKTQIEKEYMPYGNILVVDDVETNIYVANGLMKPYGLTIDTAGSGFSALDKIKAGRVYDIIFMDHMMPKMDGVETTKHIREFGYTGTIVALTANAVAGQAEIFLSSGFDDFISKPIELRQLNLILNKHIRDKQPPEIVESARKEAEERKLHLEEEAHLEIAIDPHLIEIFARDANKSLSVLDKLMAKENPLNDDEMRTYVIHTHGMKSALANIGKIELSAVALKLEQYGRVKNINRIAAETPEFLKMLRNFINENALTEKAADVADEDKFFLNEKLLAIKAACEEYDEETAENILALFMEKQWSAETKKLLNAIAEHLLHSDFDEVVKLIENIIN